MKKQLAIIMLSMALIDANGFATGHPAKAPRAGDTVWPGSPEWVHAGSPRSAITGDSISLICGSDGKLHSLGYEIEDADGSWVANTLANRETIRLMSAVKEIVRDIPDRIILTPVDSLNVSVATPDTGYDPYNEIMQWADSIARVFDDPDFYQEEENYYRSPERLDESMYDPRVKS
jgi:hypothetical protein